MTSEVYKGHTKPEQILMGRCISDIGVEHCGYCIDRCDASTNKFKLIELLNGTGASFKGNDIGPIKEPLIKRIKKLPSNLIQQWRVSKDWHFFVRIYIVYRFAKMILK